MSLNSSSFWILCAVLYTLHNVPVMVTRIFRFHDLGVLCDWQVLISNCVNAILSDLIKTILSNHVCGIFVNTHYPEESFHHHKRVYSNVY